MSEVQACGHPTQMIHPEKTGDIDGTNWCLGCEAEAKRFREGQVSELRHMEKMARNAGSHELADLFLQRVSLLLPAGGA